MAPAYREGQQAYHEQAEVSDNPYACNVPGYMQPVEALDWREGWEDENRKHRAKLIAREGAAASMQTLILAQLNHDERAMRLAAERHAYWLEQMAKREAAVNHETGETA